MLNTPDYLTITKRRTECAACGTSLLESDRHPSVLVEPAESQPGEQPAPEPVPAADKAPADEGPAFQRFDYCEECWQKIKDQAFFSFWIGRRNATDIPPQKLNRHERNLALLALFDSLAERSGDETDYAPHLFFLAHLLMRYRIFKYLPGETDSATGAAVLRFSRSDGEEEARVADVNLSPEEVVRVKEEVEAYLEQSTGQRIAL